jgi:pre-mRNA-processing factor 40
MNGGPAAASGWREATNADGRIYYYHSVTKATQWTKPVELMSVAEVRQIRFSN